MKKLLIVVDMQEDFISGALGTKKAEAIVPAVVDKITAFDGDVVYTRDTHTQQYLDTAEGRKLPVVHCVKDTAGWQIHPEILKARLWETPIAVCKECCAGVTPASHENALAAMAMCQIEIV